VDPIGANAAEPTSLQPAPLPRRLDAPMLWTVIGLWAFAVLGGLATLWSYSNRPGQTPHAPKHWPSGSAIPRTEGKMTLVMLAHPHCPCSRASLDELARVITHCVGRVESFVVFYRPADRPEDWARSDLLDTAAALPTVRTLFDVGGREVRRFGATTSGTVLLFDEAGGLLFCGGITGARGHEGDNAGRDAVVKLIQHMPAERRSTFVFGCSLLGDDRPCDPNDSAGRLECVRH
jgi:hypothetical protein